MAVGRVYVLKDAAGIRRYAGSSKTSESVRLANHKSVLAHDPLASGLYRYVHANGGFDGWTIETVMTIDQDPVLLWLAHRHRQIVGERLMNVR